MHRIDKYIDLKTRELDITDKVLSLKSDISQGQISKLRNGKVPKLSARTFYKLVMAIDGKFDEAESIIFPELKNIKLKKIQHKKRNEFGAFMRQFEVESNTPRMLVKLLGISEERFFELYYRNGSLEAKELLLIEKAIGKQKGELFHLFFSK